MPTSPAFDRAVAITLVNEGGARYTENAVDRGGPTKFGITLKTLSAWRKTTCTPSDVKNLQEPEARAIYYGNYWTPLRCEQVQSVGLGLALFDAGVLTGVGNAARQLQSAVGGLVVDGAVGPKTLAATNAAESVGTTQAFSFLLQRAMVADVKANPEQQQFLIGWLKRAAVMQSMPFIYT